MDTIVIRFSEAVPVDSSAWSIKCYSKLHASVNHLKGITGFKNINLSIYRKIEL